MIVFFHSLTNSNTKIKINILKVFFFLVEQHFEVTIYKKIYILIKNVMNFFYNNKHKKIIINRKRY